MATVYIEPKNLNISTDLKKYLSRSGSDKPDYEVIEKEIIKAESLVNSKIGGVYELPLTDAEETAFIKGFVEDIAIYNLYSKTSATRPESIIDNYNNAIRELNNIRDRKQSIGMDTSDDMAAKRAAFGRIVRR